MHKRIMDHASKSAAASSTLRSNATAEIQAVNSFMYLPMLSPVAMPAVSDTSDPIKARIKDHDEFPTHHPSEMRVDGRSTRFHYKCTCIPELTAMLDFLLDTYRIHVTNKHCDEASREQMDRYLTNFPLGNTKPEFTDTVYYKNANRISETVHANAALAAGVAPTPLPEPVLTDFAQSHIALQKHLYMSLRANYHRFMDKSSTIVLNNIIESYERTNSLTGEERLEPGKRYSWERMKSDLTKMCCIATKGGYYFLPLYTTMREDGSAVQTWANKVLTLYRLLEKHDGTWAKLAQSDASSHRTHAFFSKKELEVIDNFLNDLNRTHWNSAGKSTYGYFEKFGIETAVEAINKIAPNKFPANFIAKVHTPQAIKASLYTWDKVQKIVEGILAEHKNKVSKLEAEITRLKRELAAAKSAKPQRQQTPRARVTVTNTNSNKMPIDQINRSKHPEIAHLSNPAWQRLCNPNKTGAKPCSECLKLGMRYFHDACDPVRREANFKKQKQRAANRSPQKHNRPPKPFPPPGGRAQIQAQPVQGRCLHQLQARGRRPQIRQPPLPRLLQTPGR